MNTTHHISTSIEHWKFLKEGTPIDLQPKPIPFFELGDIISYQPYGDSYNERVLKMKIVELIDGKKLGEDGYQLIILDYVNEHDSNSINPVYIVMWWIAGVLMIFLLFKIIASIYRLFF